MHGQPDLITVLLPVSAACGNFFSSSAWCVRACVFIQPCWLIRTETGGIVTSSWTVFVLRSHMAEVII